MLKVRKSVFSEVGKALEKYRITEGILLFANNSGIGDFFYRIFSKKYLEERRKFFEQSKVKENIQVITDEKSKRIYQGLIKYKCMRYRKDFPEYSKEDQYFPEDIIKLGSNEVFVDCGAYIGDTIGKFLIQTNNKYKRIVGFEPDNKNFNVMKENLKNVGNKFLYNSGVYSSNTKLNFNESKGDCSNVSELGDSVINVMKLDDIEECIDATFIKMDIEGSELEALKGAENIIKTNKPKLAICIYHSDYDFVDIIDYIHNLVPEYKIFIRQHAPFEPETVMYAI